MEVKWKIALASSLLRIAITFFECASHVQKREGRKSYVHWIAYGISSRSLHTSDRSQQRLRTRRHNERIFSSSFQCNVIRTPTKHNENIFLSSNLLSRFYINCTFTLHTFCITLLFFSTIFFFLVFFYSSYKLQQFEQARKLMANAIHGTNASVLIFCSLLWGLFW